MRARLVTIAALLLAASVGLAASAVIATPTAEAQGYAPYIYEAADPVCINSAVVLDNEALATESIGNDFRNDADNLVYTISGGDVCGFGCIHGFDVNCDGVIGDYCDVSIDRTSVAGVSDCLWALAAASAEEPLDARVALDIPTTLAHTGSESEVLAYFGAGLVGFGALAVGAARRSRRS